MREPASLATTELRGHLAPSAWLPWWRHSLALDYCLDFGGLLNNGALDKEAKLTKPNKTKGIPGKSKFGKDFLLAVNQ